MRLVVLVAVGACAASCGPAPLPQVARPPPLVTTVRSASADEEVLARLAKERGVLDVAAAHLGRAFQKTATPEKKRAWGVALADAWAFEDAREVLADFPDELAKLPTGNLATENPDGDRIERVLVALGRRDGKSAREEIAPLVNPRASPLVLELAGRARLMLQEQVEARRMFARARSRVDALSGGAKDTEMGMAATTAGAVRAIATRSGRVIVGRARERYLIGGYQSNRTSMWIESYGVPDPDPFVRWSSEHFDAFASSADGRAIALAELQYGSTSTKTMARVFDSRTGLETSSFERPTARFVAFGAGGLLVTEEQDVAVTDLLGHLARTLTITGTTPVTSFAYSARSAPTMDASMTYPSQVSDVASAKSGAIAVGATDGNVWIWPSGKKPPFVLKPPDHTPRGASPSAVHDREPFVMRFDESGDAITIASADGAVTSWDLAKRKSRELVTPTCTAQELATSSPALTSTSECAQSRSAVLSPDGSRIVFSRLWGGPRVRDAKTGDALSVLDTYDADVIDLDDAGMGWIGSAFGTINHWNTTTGERAESLPQGGISGFLQSVSSDGRFVVVMEGMTIGAGGAGAGNGRGAMVVSSTPALGVWDATTHTLAPNLSHDISRLRFFEGPIAQVTTRTHGSFAFDMLADKRLFDIAADETNLLASRARDRFVSMRGRQKIVVRGLGGTLREIDAAARIDVLAIDQSAHIVAALTDGGAATPTMTGEIAVWSLDDGRSLFRLPAQRGSTLAVSPEGHSVVWRADNKTLIVAAVDDHHEIARITPKDLSPDQAYGSIRTAAFVSEDDLLVVGPGEPGFQRLYRWSVNGKAKPTELQVLTGDRIEIASTGVATVYDRGDSAYLVRTSDGALLASIYATTGVGFLAVSREGAVDASSPEAQSAAVTSIDDAKIVAGRSSWLGWDRFAVPDLLERAARGEIVSPPMRAWLARTTTLLKQRDAAARDDAP